MKSIHLPGGMLSVHAANCGAWAQDESSATCHRMCDIYTAKSEGWEQRRVIRDGIPDPSGICWICPACLRQYDPPETVHMLDQAGQKLTPTVEGHFAVRKGTGLVEVRLEPDDDVDLAACGTGGTVSDAAVDAFEILKHVTTGKTP